MNIFVDLFEVTHSWAATSNQNQRNLKDMKEDGLEEEIFANKDKKS